MEALVEIPALESKIEQELVKHNVTDAVLSALKEKYAGLRLRSVDDKETFLEIKEAAKECSKVRNLIVKCCKVGREEAVKIQKLWVSKEKETVAKVTEVEAPLDAEITRFNAEVERKQIEEKNRQEEAYMQRTQALTRMGALYSDGSFALGDFSMEGNLVRETSNDVWNNEVLPRFTEEYNKGQAERVEADRVKSEKEAEIKRQASELEKNRREFEEQQAQFKKQQEDAARAEVAKQQENLRKEEEVKNETIKNRLSLLAGWTYNGFTIYRHGEEFRSKNDFLLLNDTEFRELVKENEFFIIDQINQQEKERAIQLQKVQEEAAQKERERIAEEQRQAELKRQQEAQIKAEELERSVDKVKFANLMAQFAAIKLPEMRSGQYRKKTAIIREKLEEILSLKTQG